MVVLADHRYFRSVVAGCHLIGCRADHQVPAEAETEPRGTHVTATSQRVVFRLHELRGGSEAARIGDQHQRQQHPTGSSSDVSWRTNSPSIENINDHRASIKTSQNPYLSQQTVLYFSAMTLLAGLRSRYKSFPK